MLDMKGAGGKWNRSDASLTNWGEPNWEAGNHQIQEENEENGDYHGSLECRPRDVLFVGNGNGPTSDLDWEELGNMGPIVRGAVSRK